MKKTINEVLVIQKVIRERVNSLTQLRNSNSREERFLYGKEETKVVTPQYDPKVIDRKVTELQRFLLESDARVKASNAVTEVEIEMDIDKLLSPIE